MHRQVVIETATRPDREADGPRSGDVARALRDLAAGRMAVVVDDGDETRDGLVVLAAEHASPEAIDFLLTAARGLVCAALPPARLEQLRIPPMPSSVVPVGPVLHVGVDARRGVTTGSSAADRSATIAALADPATTYLDLTVPGHVFPVATVAGGVLTRPSPAQAASDACREAGLSGVAVLCDIVRAVDAGGGRAAAERFAASHDLPLLPVGALVRELRAGLPEVERVVRTQLPVRGAVFTATGYRDCWNNREHLALTLGDVRAPDVLVRIHSECVLGDAFGSRDCPCGEQLRVSLDRIVRAGRGAVVYLRGEGDYGVGLLRKLGARMRAGAQPGEQGLAHPLDMRDYRVASQIVTDLGIGPMLLLTNHAPNVPLLRGAGLDVSGSVRLPVPDSVESGAG